MTSSCGSRESHEAALSRSRQPELLPDSGAPVDYVEDLLSGERLRRAGYFDAEAVRKLAEKCRAGRAIGFSDNMAFVGVLSTMLLDESFIRSPQPGTSVPHAPVTADFTCP